MSGPSQAGRDGADRQVPIGLRDGTVVIVRPLEPSDKELLTRGFERLSSDTRYRRFATAIAALSDAQLTYLTDVAHHDREALVALDPDSGDLAGIARFVRLKDEPHVAETAITITDAWQCRGLGTARLDAIADRARAEGISRFSATVQADNSKVLALLEGFGESVRKGQGTQFEVLVDLPPRGGRRPAPRPAAGGRCRVARRCPSRRERARDVQATDARVAITDRPGRGLSTAVHGHASEAVLRALWQRNAAAVHHRVRDQLRGARAGDRHLRGPVRLLRQP